MKKEDVEYHGLGYGYRTTPAVNVKVDAWNAYEEWRKANPEEDERFTREWLEEHTEFYGSGEPFWTWAIEDGWEELRDIAQEIYGPGTKVYSEGRCGGWAYVEGGWFSPDVKGWDAIELGKWARFCRLARLTADDVPYQMVSLAYYNHFMTWCQDQWNQQAYAFGDCA